MKRYVGICMLLALVLTGFSVTQAQTTKIVVYSALPDLESVRTIERPDDKHRYLVLVYRGGLEIPSWMASDGTLTRETYVWTPGQDGWMRAEDVAELAQLFTVLPPPPPGA